MALMKSKQIPDDAVVLSEQEATNYIWEVVRNWESLSDTWALQYAPGILGSINGICGILINRHYRQKLKLGQYGYFASVIPICLLPGVFTALFHRHLISSDMLLMKMDSCPLCYEIRSGLNQVAFGIAYPMVLGPTSALMFANRYSTYRIPDLREGPKVMFNFLKSKTRPLTATLTYMLAIQMIASSMLTYFEMKNNIALKRKLMEIEKEAMSEDVARK